ncbi:MAG: family N-acetyltransferase [Bacteroidetes bacterium]|nr:family N-acetyltransferase [Bacteroidota bacterium]
MLELLLQPFQELETKRLVLRQLRQEDATDLFAIRSDERTLQFLDKDPDASVDATLAFINRVHDSFLDNDAMPWVIALKSNDKVIGMINFWNIQKAHYRSEIGYILHPDHWNMGIMSEALEIVLDFGFSTLKFHSVEANVNPKNAGSIKVLEKQGFVKEAYFKENYYYNGVFLDSLIYSKLAPKG